MNLKENQAAQKYFFETVLSVKWTKAMTNLEILMMVVPTQRLKV